MLVKKDLPIIGGKGGNNPHQNDFDADLDENCLSTDEQLEGRDYVQTLGNSANSPRPSNQIAINNRA